jgi:hypothetical protein
MRQPKLNDTVRIPANAGLLTELGIVEGVHKVNNTVLVDLCQFGKKVFKFDEVEVITLPAETASVMYEESIEAIANLETAIV